MVVLVVLIEIRTTRYYHYIFRPPDLLSEVIQFYRYTFFSSLLFLECRLTSLVHSRVPHTKSRISLGLVEVLPLFSPCIRSFSTALLYTMLSFPCSHFRPFPYSHQFLPFSSALIGKYG